MRLAGPLQSLRECAADEDADELPLVLLGAVGVLDGPGRLRRRGGDVLHRGSSDEQRLRLARTDRHRADRTDGDSRLLDDTLGCADPDGDGRGWPLAKGQLAMRDARPCGCRRHAHRHEQLAFGQRGFVGAAQERLEWKDA